MNTPDNESDLFDFAVSRRRPKTPDEQLLRELHGALGETPLPRDLHSLSGYRKEPPMTTLTLHPSRHAQPWQLHRFITIAAALAIVLGTIGYGLRNNERPETPLAPQVPGLAMQSPTVTESCLDTDTPLMFFGDGFPIDHPALLITSDGTLKLRCSASSEPIVLDTNVGWVDSTAVAGTIVIYKALDEHGGNTDTPAVSTSLMNLQTGGQIDLGITPDGAIFRQAIHSPWYVAPSSDDPGAIVVVDLRTLDSHTILASDSDSTATGAIVTSNEEGSITAIALVTRDSLSGGGGFVVGRDSEQPEVLILHDTFEPDAWMPLTSPAGPVDDLLFSPNGKHLALEVVDGLNTYGIKRAIQYIVIDPNTGDTVASSDVATDFPISSSSWGLDSSRFIYISGTDLYVLEPDTSAEPRLVTSANGGMEYLVLTPDPDIVIVNVRTPRQEPIATTNRISLVSGEMDLIGAAMPVPYYPSQKRTPIISTFDGTTARFMDAATGETIAEAVYPNDIEAEATPTSTYPTVNLFVQSPVFTGIDTDDMQIWVWGDDLQVQSLPAPSEPEDQFRYAATTTADGRFIILQNYRFYAVDGTPIDPSSTGPVEVIYILDTQAEEPAWIPAN